MLRLSVLTLLLVTAAQAGSVSLTLDGAAAYALAHNPALAAARLRIEEARGRLQQSGRLSNPELELEFTRNTLGREGSAGIAFTQRFPFTSRLRHEKAFSRAELASAEADVRDAERKLAAEVRTTGVKLLALRGQRDLRSKQLGNSRELSDFLLKRVAAGEASVVDASQVELESRQIEVEDLMLAADEVRLLGELRPLLGIAGDVRIAITGELPAPKNIPATTEVARRPDILAAQSRAEAARAVALAQRARRWEDIGVGATYSYERVIDEPKPVATEQVVGLRFSLPLPFWNNNAGRIGEAEAAAARAEQEVSAAKLTANAEVIAARSAIGAYAKLIGELDDQVLPAATRIEEQLRNSYSTGQTPLTDVLRARSRRLELQRQRLDALRDYQLACIRHSAATGQSNPISK
jgi:cobalt-zinc-cadmium efflux system outer membrane protein